MKNPPCCRSGTTKGGFLLNNQIPKMVIKNELFRTFKIPIFFRLSAENPPPQVPSYPYPKKKKQWQCRGASVAPRSASIPSPMRNSGCGQPSAIILSKIVRTSPAAMHSRSAGSLENETAASTKTDDVREVPSTNATPGFSQIHRDSMCFSR